MTAAWPSRHLHVLGELRVCFIAAKPHWVQPIEDVELAVEDSLSWQCRAGGKPTPSYRWLKDGAALALEVRPRPASPHPPPDTLWDASLAPEAGRCGSSHPRSDGAGGGGDMGKIKPLSCLGRDFRLNFIGKR